MNIVTKIVGHSPTSDFACRIIACWQRSAEAFIETGRILTEAKAALPHGDFLQMVEAELPFDKRVAQMLMKIAGDKRLTDTNNVSLLPAHYSSLYELTKLDDRQFGARVADGTIRPTMERKEITLALKKERRVDRERKFAAKAFPAGQFSVIYADPPWKLEAWSDETGLERAADQHYPTMTVDQICGFSDPDGRHVSEIVARNAVLFLWITVPFLDRMADVLRAWGPVICNDPEYGPIREPWKYVSNFCWDKAHPSTGRWTRNQHELLLIARVGDVPAPDDLQASIYHDPAREHSRKPEFFASLIEQYFPNSQKIELFRRGPARLGWSAWGFETIQEAA